jgi:hypothetical protein
MPTVQRHPDGVIVNGRLYARDDFHNASQVTPREWLAFGVLSIGLTISALLMLTFVAVLGRVIVRVFHELVRWP